MYFRCKQLHYALLNIVEIIVKNVANAAIDVYKITACEICIVDCFCAFDCLFCTLLPLIVYFMMERVSETFIIDSDIEIEKILKVLLKNRL